ncbi:MAG: hypothetical protein LBI35_02695 [Burkholderiales bacterium]|jgi:hypothetical protein|nr:hypothetical protein [Burkholderiales bacterium]
MSANKFTLGKVFFIEWLDAFGCPAGWEFEDEAETKVTAITSVGFLVKETDDFVCLAPHVSGSDRRQIAGHISIPKKAILKIEVISPSPLASACLAFELGQTRQRSSLSPMCSCCEGVG